MESDQQKAILFKDSIFSLKVSFFAVFMVIIIYFLVK